MQVRKLKTRSHITISAESELTPRELALTNQSLVTVLSKKAKGELGAYLVPQNNGDVFRRRIIISRIPKRPEIGTDIPDLADTQFTDLPWVGYTTFLDAHRAFRSKYYLTVVVEVVREIDGYLYSLCIPVPDQECEPGALRLVDVPMVSPHISHYDMTIRIDLDDEIKEKQFSKAPVVPETLIKDMKALGYILEGDVFSHPEVPGLEGRIQCKLWGKIVRTHHLREVK